MKEDGYEGRREKEGREKALTDIWAKMLLVQALLLENRPLYIQFISILPLYIQFISIWPLIPPQR